MTPQEFSESNPWKNHPRYDLIHNTGDAALLLDKKAKHILFAYRCGSCLQEDRQQRELFESVMRKHFGGEKP